MIEDYSITKLRNRLAVEGEELIAHRFQNGMTRMVDRADFERWQRARADGENSRPPTRHGWQSLKQYVVGFLTYYGFVDDASRKADEPGPVVAIPSEALVRVFGLPLEWQEQHQLAACEDALFIEFSPPWGVAGRGLCFGNGVVIPLRLLEEGQRIKVLRRSWADSLEPELVHVRS